MKKLIQITILLTLTSCATDIDYHVPLTRFDSPETKGDFLAGDVGINWGVSHRVRTAEVAESIFPSIFDPTIDNDTATERRSHGSINASLGLLKRLDFNYESFGDGPSMYGVKFQFFGAPEMAKSKGFKASIKGSIGGMSEDEGTLSVNTTSGTRSYNGNIDVDAMDAALNVGYRFNPTFLMYLNSVYSDHKVKSTLSSTSFDTVVVNGNVQTLGTLLGLRISNDGGSMFLKIEGGYFKSSWNSSIEQESVPIGVGVDIGW
jgi:hypothetical protein